MADSGDWRPRLVAIANYQFGRGAGDAVFADPIDRVTRSASGRPKQVIAPRGRIVTLGTDGRFTLGYAGGRRLREALPHPAYRVIVGDESAPYVADGRNAFAKFVLDADPEIRGGDEVLVLQRVGADPADHALVGVGRAAIDAAAMADFETGVAVEIREGVDEFHDAGTD